MEAVKRIKCSCGNCFVVTKDQACDADVDFSGPDVYIYNCPSCGNTHRVCWFEFHIPTALERFFWDL